MYKLVVPFSLSVFYPFAGKSNGLVSPVFWLCLAAVVVSAAGIAFSSRYTRKVVFGALFFFVTVLPTAFLLHSNPALVADRYTYIPLIGLLYVFAEGIGWAYRKAGPPRVTKKFFLIFVVVMLIAGTFILTWQRVKV